MEACTAVERELDKVTTKFTNFSNNLTRNIDDKIAFLDKLRNDLVNEGADPSASPNISGLNKALLKQATAKIADTAGSVATEHRDLHSTVSKVGKAIDRNFVPDFDSTSREDAFSGQNKSHLINEVILQHFSRQGSLEMSQTLAEESGIHEYKSQREPFQELNTVIQALRRKDLEPALEWAAKKREMLNAQGSEVFGDFSGRGGRSSLELRLHKLKFIHLLSTGHKMEAILYARKNFPRFVKGEEKEVQSLMGAVMYSGEDLAKSPYAHLLDNAHWAETEDMFLREASGLLGLSVESPLAVAVNAGCSALPALLNIKQIMLQRQVSGVWSDKDELPIEIDLPSQCRYHSVFACPILRQQVSEANPPMRLTCGHVISRDALAKLAAGHKLKCPYCPVEQNPTDARQIVF